MLACVAIGVTVGLYLLWWILTHTHTAAIVYNHIDYVTEARHSDAIGVAYLDRDLPADGVFLTPHLDRTGSSIVLTGSVTAHIFYWEAFTSVWCFFAAAASIVILAHFEHIRRQHLRTAGAW